MSQDARALTLQTLTQLLVSDSAAYEDARRPAEQLAEAVERRAVIEQAEGVLMGKDHDLSPDAAFGMLARAARRQDVPVRIVAQRVVDERDPADSRA